MFILPHANLGDVGCGLALINLRVLPKVSLVCIILFALIFYFFYDSLLNNKKYNCTCNESLYL